MSALDRSIFHWMNAGATAPWLDPVMVIASNSRFWQVALLLIVLWLLLRRDRPGALAAITLVVAVGLSDLVAAQVLKPLLARERPCHVLEGVRLLVHCGGRNGFPSNHASNAAAAATALGVFFPGSWRATLPLALLVAWSRVYVGVHYPGDVMGGLLLGAAIGLSIGSAARFSLQKRPTSVTLL